MVMICDDVLHWAETYSGLPFHALIADPPYHLISDTRNGSMRKPGTGPFGRLGISTKGFMEQDWDGGNISFRPETWKSLAAHLLPGAFGACFASSRGWHRLACAIEDAGLIIHPSIFMLGWTQGAGWPKATKIDTQVDAAAGVEREVIGPWVRLGDAKAYALNPASHVYGADNGSVTGWRPPVTAPATPLAAIWAGHRYGLQALKPALEPIIIWQKPYAGRPVDSITQTGAGALWIEGTRIAGPEPHHNYGRTSGPQSFVGKSDEPLNTPPSGRWPANVVLIHHEACERVGTRQVKGTKIPGPGMSGIGYGGSSGYSGSSRKSGAKSNYTAPDGTETVPAWRCAPGGIFTVPAYVLGTSDVVSLADEPERLLDQFQALLGVIQSYSTACSTPLRHAVASYGIADILEGDSWDGLACAVARVLGVTEFLNYPGDCQFYPHWCDVHLHRVVTACQDGLPLLRDALDLVYQDLCSLVYTHLSQQTVLPSSSGDFLPDDRVANTAACKTSGESCLHEFLDETWLHNIDKAVVEQHPAGLDGNRQADSISVDGSHKRYVDSSPAGTVAAVRLLWALVFDLARRFLPALIMQRRDIVINLSKCPVAALDAQAGERKSGITLPGQESRTKFSGRTYASDATSLAMGGLPGGYGDTGPVSRFFPCFGWADDVAEQLAAAQPAFYCGKASQAERNAGLVERNPHNTIKPQALLRWLASLLLPPAAYAPRRLLVPFAGVGSEITAATEVGWEEVVGVEQDPTYVALAEERLVFRLGLFANHTKGQGRG
jgi:hypothetical protein